MLDLVYKEDFTSAHKIQLDLKHFDKKPPMAELHKMENGLNVAHSMGKFDELLCVYFGLPLTESLEVVLVETESEMLQRVKTNRSKITLKPNNTERNAFNVNHLIGQGFHCLKMQKGSFSLGQLQQIANDHQINEENLLKIRTDGRSDLWCVLSYPEKCRYSGDFNQKPVLNF